MSVQPITVNLPSALYSRLRRRAEQSRRTVEAELLDDRWKAGATLRPSVTPPEGARPHRGFR